MVIFLRPVAHAQPFGADDVAGRCFLPGHYPAFFGPPASTDRQDAGQRDAPRRERVARPGAVSHAGARAVRHGLRPVPSAARCRYFPRCRSSSRSHRMLPSLARIGLDAAVAYRPCEGMGACLRSDRPRLRRWGQASHGPRIAAALIAALGDAGPVLNVGAGTGSYEPVDRPVVAVDPSPVMLAQRPGGSAPCVAGGRRGAAVRGRQASARRWRCSPSTTGGTSPRA